jgi:predicted membrane channel-forming protein YqfA (hemolysin III family)
MQEPNLVTGFFVLLGALVVVYFIPTLVASFRERRNTTAIFVLNLFLGWTLLGWVAALVWAFVDDRSTEVHDVRSSPKPPLIEPGRRMTRKEKIEYMLNDLTHRGVKKSMAAPLGYRVLWRLGFDLTPPLFQNPWLQGVFIGAFTGVLFGIGCFFFGADAPRTSRSSTLSRPAWWQEFYLGSRSIS